MSMQSLIPFILERRRALEQLCMNDDDLLSAVAPFMSGDYSPWRRQSHGQQEGSIKADNTKFQINLDVHHFAPEEVTVKTAEGFILVEGSHEEKRDEHGWVSRKFTRRYPLPEGCNIEAVQSRLSSDGVLSVVCPLETKSNERLVPIVHTGPVRKETQENLQIQQ